MVFSSPLFVFVFLPVVLTIYLILPGTRGRNAWLLAMSVAFYAWGEMGFTLLLLASTGVNYLLGLWVDRHEDPASRKMAAIIAVVANIGLLAFFKYANFAVSTLNSVLTSVGATPIEATQVPLPIGISFFTFHALSYVIDVYRRKWKASADPRDVALYIFFFPQLIAGPILRWSAIGPQLIRRALNRDDFAEGVRRFISGLCKKVLIANTVALPADQVFAVPLQQLATVDAWFGIVCYTLQIYFDFSGYSDMAVGMGKMFGFQFLENFQFPYVARSIRDFWRRWHISLSTWFRDYLYIPLGGNRASEGRTHLNLVIVFFVCGLWHGASWAFAVWGLYHGCFLVLERTRLGRLQEKLPGSLQHAYTILVVMMGWVLFRAETLASAGQYLLVMGGMGQPVASRLIFEFGTNQVFCAIILGIVFSGPSWSGLKRWGSRLIQGSPLGFRPALQAFGATADIALNATLLLVSVVWLAGGTYNPFIYFRF